MTSEEHKERGILTISTRNIHCSVRHYGHVASTQNDILLCFKIKTLFSVVTVVV